MSVKKLSENKIFLSYPPYFYRTVTSKQTFFEVMHILLVFFSHTSGRPYRHIEVMHILLVFFSHTSGRPARGNGYLRLEIRDPTLKHDPANPVVSPVIIRTIKMVRLLKKKVAAYGLSQQGVWVSCWTPTPLTLVMLDPHMGEHIPWDQGYCGSTHQIRRIS